MPAKVSETLKVLVEIRDEIRKTNERVDAIEHSVLRLEHTVLTELTATRNAVGEVTKLMRDRRDRVGTRLDDHEQRLRKLERKTG